MIEHDIAPILEVVEPWLDKCVGRMTTLMTPHGRKPAWHHKDRDTGIEMSCDMSNESIGAICEELAEIIEKRYSDNDAVTVSVEFFHVPAPQVKELTVEVWGHGNISICTGSWSTVNANYFYNGEEMINGV